MIKVQAKNYSKSLIAIVVAFFCATLINFFASLTSKNDISSVEVLKDFLIGTFSSQYYFGMMLNTMGIMIFASCGAAFSQTSGNMNLGGAAQIYIGGFICAVLLKNQSFPPIVAFVICMCAAGCIAAISGLLKAYKNVSELLTSFLISAGIIPFIDNALQGKFRDATKTLVATESISKNHMLKNLLEPSPFNISFFIAIIIAIVFYLYFKYTNTGKRISLCGKAEEFATYCGYNIKAATVVSMFVSGAMHGAAGYFIIVGNLHKCYAGFYGSLNWDAISVSLIAQNNPIAIIFASLFMSYIFTSSQYTSMLYNFSFDVTSLVQSIVMFTITANFFTKKEEKNARKFF